MIRKKMKWISQAGYGVEKIPGIITFRQVCYPITVINLPLKPTGINNPEA